MTKLLAGPVRNAMRQHSLGELTCVCLVNQQGKYNDPRSRLCAIDVLREA